MKVKNLDISKSDDSNAFFAVYITTNEDKKHKLIILNNDQFLIDIQRLQTRNVKLN